MNLTKNNEHVCGLGEFIMGELDHVLATYMDNDMEGDDIYDIVFAITSILSSSEPKDGDPIEVSCLFDELVNMNLGVFSKNIHQAAAVYSVLLAYWSDTAHPQLHFSWSKR